MLYPSCRYLVGSSFINISATPSTGSCLGLNTKLGLDQLMPTSGSALRECTFWPVSSLTDWELRCIRCPQGSGFQPSTGHSRSVTSSTTNIDWKSLDTVETPATHSSMKATGLVTVCLATTNTTGWILRHMTGTTTRKVVVGGTTVVSWHV